MQYEPLKEPPPQLVPTFLPTLLQKLQNPITRGVTLKSLFRLLNPHLASPLPENILAAIPNKKKLSLFFLPNPKFTQELLEKNPSIQIEPQNTISFPAPENLTGDTPTNHTTFQAILLAAQTEFSHLITLEKTYKLLKEEETPAIPISRPFPIHLLASQSSQKLLEEIPNLQKRKGQLQTLQYNPRSQLIDFIPIQTLPPKPHTRLSQIPLLLKYGATRRLHLFDTTTHSTLYLGAYTLEGRKHLAQSCAEAQKLGMLGIPTWIV